MNKLLSDVKIFHETYLIPIATTPTIPNQNRIDLRLNLIKEEIKELDVAINNKDIIEVTDALVDLMYVINGALLEFGLHNKIFDDSYDFVTFFNSTVPDEPTVNISENEIADLKYLNLVVDDLEDALRDNYIGDVLDCLTDLVEMTIIIAINFGLTNYFHKCHDEIQASNMSKLGVDGKPIYREDGKVLKGPNFFKPNLQKILNKKYAK